MIFALEISDIRKNLQNLMQTYRSILFIDSGDDGGDGHEGGRGMEDAGVGVEMAEVEVDVEYGRGRG